MQCVSMLTTIAALTVSISLFLVRARQLDFSSFFFTNLGPQCCIDQYAEIQTSVTQNLLEA